MTCRGMSEPRRDRAAARQWRVSAEGVARVETRSEGKRKTRVKTICHCEERSDAAIRFLFTQRKSTPLSKEETDSHDQFENWSRNDRCFLYIALSFPQWHYPKTGDPSVGFAASSPKRGAAPRRSFHPPHRLLKNALSCSKIPLILTKGCFSHEGFRASL